MNNTQRREIAQEYVGMHKTPLAEWTASSSDDPLLTIYYQILNDSEVDEDDPELRTIEIPAREHKNDRPEIIYFDNED